MNKEVFKWFVVSTLAFAVSASAVDKKKIDFSAFTKQKKPAVLEAEDAIVFVSE